jgi:hypothetical protein
MSSLDVNIVLLWEVLVVEGENLSNYIKCSVTYNSWCPYTPSCASKLVHRRKEWSTLELFLLRRAIQGHYWFVYTLKVINRVPGKSIVSSKSLFQSHMEKTPKLASLLAKAICTDPVNLNCSAVARMYNTEYLPISRIKNSCKDQVKKAKMCTRWSLFVVSR